VTSYFSNQYVNTNIETGFFFSPTVCRHAEATAENGKISPIAGDTRDIRDCAFKINAVPYQQQIRIVCSVIILIDPSPGIYLNVS
jgi:hypothetical protein